MKSWIWRLVIPQFSSVYHPTSALFSLFVLVLFSLQPLRSSVAVGSPAVTDLLPDNLEAVLIPDQGYHQVGPADHCSDMFILSITVAFATKLEQVRTVLCHWLINSNLRCYQAVRCCCFLR